MTVNIEYLQYCNVLHGIKQHIIQYILKWLTTEAGN